MADEFLREDARSVTSQPLTKISPPSIRTIEATCSDGKSETIASEVFLGKTGTAVFTEFAESTTVMTINILFVPKNVGFCRNTVASVRSKQRFFIIFHSSPVLAFQLVVAKLHHYQRNAESFLDSLPRLRDKFWWQFCLKKKNKNEDVFSRVQAKNRYV